MLKLHEGINKFALDTPCLVIDKKLLDYNLSLMQEHAGEHNIHLRPHVKTHKCSKLAKLQIEHGAIGVSAAKVSEAEVLINNGITHVLITSPLVTPNKIFRLIACVKKDPTTLVVVDNEKNLIDLNTAGQSIQTKINVLVDVDPGIGRTGVRPDLAVSFALKAHELPWLNLMGIQCYAGNLQHVTAYKDRRMLSLQTMKVAEKLVKEFKTHGLNCSILSGSGTGTYDIDCEVSEVTEIQPGSYTVMDVEYSMIGSKSNRHSFSAFQPAMTMLTTVISSNRNEHVTVDAGTKSIYLDKVHKPKIISHPGLEYDWGGFGDEHGKIFSTNGSNLPTNGEVIELIVPHCDPTINLFDKFFITENNLLIDVWEIDLRGKAQ